MILVFLAVTILPPASAGDESDLDKYLDCSSSKIVDIVFVFDTSGSMGGEINELCAIAGEFAKDLKASRVDYRLGLVEFRDFPLSCDDRRETPCGETDDYAYKVRGDGNLTADVNTFSSWLKLLSAKGGADGPEAVLAALRHAMSDLQWRSDAEKMIIVLTDAPPHPDGDCCNAEGDTLDGTIFGLTSQGARVHVIGPEDASLKRISDDTGGQFFKIRSGLSLKPLLKEVTGAMSCSFNVETEATCESRVLEAKVQLVGKEAIPFVAGQTDAWMYLDQAGSKSRYNLSYDSAAGAYLAEVPGVCGPVELTVYGRVGDRSAVQTMRVECGACGDIAATAEEKGELSISGRVYDDSNGDGVKGADEVGLEGWEILLLKPDGGSVAQKTDRKGYYIFTGLLPGSYKAAATAQENWTATAPETSVKEVELVDVHESEIDFGYKPKHIETQPSRREPISKSFLGGRITSIQPITDGGYVLAGDYWRGPYGNGFWLIKLDELGSEVWNKTYLIGEDKVALSVLVTSDGGYILAGGPLYGNDGYIPGYAGSIHTHGASLVRTDADGNELWNRTYRDTIDEFYSIEDTIDNGYILAGKAEVKTGHGDAWIIKTDTNGNELWNRTFGSYLTRGYITPIIQTDDCAYSVHQTADKGYILAGNAGSAAWLIKTDENGNELWNRTYENGETSKFYSVHPANNGDYIIAGYTIKQAPAPNQPWDNWDGWVVKTDSRGNEIWNKTFDWGDYFDSFYSIQLSQDGGIILAGGNDANVAWLVKTDSNGNELWNRTFNWAYFSSVQPTTAGGYILVGQKDDSNYAAVMEVDADGNKW